MEEEVYDSGGELHHRMSDCPSEACRGLSVGSMYAQCIYFLDGIPSDLRKVGILKAYSTASTLILTVISDDKSHELLSHSPLPTWRILYCAALVIFRVLNSTWGSHLDRSNGRVLYNASAFLMRQLSVQHNEKDIPIRDIGALEPALEIRREWPRTAEPRAEVTSSEPDGKQLGLRFRHAAAQAFCK